MFITRAYNKFELHEENGIIIKRSSENRLRNEIEHYKNIPASLSIWFPRMLHNGFEQQSKEYFLHLEFYAYENLGTYLINPNSSIDWNKIAQLINSMLQSFSDHKSPISIEEDMKKMYVEKTLSEYEKLKNGFPTFKTICAHKTLSINGKRYLNFESIWAKLALKNIEKVLYHFPKTTFFHGDMCLSNIIAGQHSNSSMAIKCIDPRGKFGSQIAKGDCYYDIAKLMHSSEGGYEYFINNAFSVEINEDHSSINFKFTNDNKDKVHEIFKREIYSNFDILKARLIQGCIFIGMCARHYDSLDRQMAMYATGVKILNEVYEEM